MFHGKQVGDQLDQLDELQQDRFSRLQWACPACGGPLIRNDENLLTCRGCFRSWEVWRPVPGFFLLLGFTGTGVTGVLIVAQVVEPMLARHIYEPIAWTVGLILWIPLIWVIFTICDQIMLRITRLREI
jgi:hypothetical protein